MNVFERDHNGATLEFTSRESIVLGALASGFTRVYDGIRFKPGPFITHGMAESFRDTIEDRGYGKDGRKFRFTELEIHTLRMIAENAVENYELTDISIIENLSLAEVEWFCNEVRLLDLVPEEKPLSTTSRNFT